MEKSKEHLLQEEVIKEAEFFDTMYTNADERHRLQNYLVPDDLVRQFTHPSRRPFTDRDYARSLLGTLEGKKLLDYGAGDGWNAICFAKARAKVWAIDISEKGIELTKKKAIANGVNEMIIAEVRNCYKTNYPANMFDIIYGGGILHHLDIDAAGQELRRILGPDGVAVFFEPFRETKIMDIIKVIVLYILRRRPSEETENEAPLTRKRIDTLKQYFKVVNCRSFNILNSASLLVDYKFLKSLLNWSDYFLIKYIPGFGKLGRAIVVELRQPIKTS